MIPAVILAGGLGTRLRPLTDRVPKALVRVRKKPFLQHQLEQLRASGIKEALLLVCYRGRQIEEAFGDGARLGMRLRYAYEDTPRGTGGALKNAEALLPEDFLLLNGDTLVRMHYAPLVEEYQRRKLFGLVVAFVNSRGVPPNNLALGPGGLVAAYQKHNPAGLTHVDAGVGVFSKRILDMIPAGQAVSLEEEIHPRLIERRQLGAFPTHERFFDMGSFAGLEALEAELNGAVEKRGTS